jgi:hypothetical protein
MARGKIITISQAKDNFKPAGGRGTAAGLVVVETSVGQSKHESQATQP